MEIFKLMRTQSGDQAGVVKTVKDIDQEDTEEIRQAKMTMGEHPSQQGQGSQDGEVQGEAFSVETKQEEDAGLVVTIDGPLGRVFTEALNKMLAVESMMMMPLTKEALVAIKKESPKTQVVKVNAFDEDMLKVADVVEVSNEITKSQEDQFVVAVESRRAVRTVNSKTQLLTNLGDHQNVQVSYRMDVAVKQVLRMVK